MTDDFSSAFEWPVKRPAIQNALIESFQSNEWGKYDGSKSKVLTNQLAESIGVEFVRLCSSGTIAVEIALAGIGIRPGDEVILAAYDFPGNFRAIESLGATPVLVDVNPANWCLDVQSVADALNPNIKCLLISHLHGGIAELDELRQLARTNEIPVIEDVCQCPGAQWMGSAVGSIGDVSVYSFGGSKLLSAGRGGAVATNDPTIWQRIKIYCDRGNDAFPLSELQAAVLVPQLDELETLAIQRNRSFALLREMINSQGAVQTIKPNADSRPDFYKVPIALPSADKKQDIIDRLRSVGIVIDHGFRGFATRSERRCRKPVSLENSKTIAANTLVLHHPCLLSDRFEEIVQRILSEIEQYLG